MATDIPYRLMSGVVWSVYCILLRMFIFFGNYPHARPVLTGNRVNAESSAMNILTM